MRKSVKRCVAGISMISIALAPIAPIFAFSSNADPSPAARFAENAAAITQDKSPAFSWRQGLCYAPFLPLRLWARNCP